MVVLAQWSWLHLYIATIIRLSNCLVIRRFLEPNHIAHKARRWNELTIKRISMENGVAEYSRIIFDIEGSINACLLLLSQHARISQSSLGAAWSLRCDYLTICWRAE